MGKKQKTHDEFCEEIYKLYGDEYFILGTYKNCKIPILIQHNCKDCDNHKWEITPNNLLRGHTCPVCSYIKRAKNRLDKKKNNFNELFYNKFGNEYKLLSEYNGSHDYIYVEHNSDLCEHYIWKVKPNDILNGHKCPICANKLNGFKRRKTQEQFEKEIYDLVGNEYTVIGKYNNSRNNKKILMRHNCEKCNNYEWDVDTFNFLNNGTRCPICGTNSKGEEIIKEYLINKNINFKMQYTFDNLKNKSLLRFDFGILNNDLLLSLVEYQGLQHYKPVCFGGISLERAKENLKEQQYNDKLKIKYCQNNNIELLKIPYWDYSNIEKILNENI